jgi:amino acid adenylation domain-containing protein
MLSFIKIEQQSLKTPDNIALIEGENRLSYRSVQKQVNLLSALLIEKKTPLSRIIIALDRGINATIAILSVLNINACYIPLDLKNPAHRLRYIVKDADVQCVIGKGKCPDWLSDSQLWFDISLLNASPHLNKEGQQELSIDAKTHDEPESLATILYTSGSTGNPKGVALSNRAINNFASWAADTFAINNDDQIASLAPFHFDLSIFDLFSCLSRGATVHFVPAHLTLSPSRLTAWLSESKITVWYTVPSLLGFIALKGSLKTTPLLHLKKILFAGEVFHTPTLIKLCELLSHVDFFNLYGPTETNVCCYWPVDRNRLLEGHTIPIGISACDAVLSIDSESGELRVQSQNNLSGYWQKGELVSAIGADNFYSTGDKVSLNQQNEYCYHGRLDRMLKCSGYRVEPAEIEQVILLCPEVENCAVIGIDNMTSGQRPAAAVILKPEAGLADIVKVIKQKLPSYMQPCKYLVLDVLPYLTNGKTDYQTLQKRMEKK